jgi:hypothetical protein
MGFKLLLKNLLARLLSYEETYYNTSGSSLKTPTQVTLEFRKRVKLPNGTEYTGFFDAISKQKEGFGI